MTESELMLSQLIDIAHKTNNITGKFDEKEDEAAFLELFEKLYFQSAKDNFFWQYCPFPVYEKKYEELKFKHLEQYPDSTEGEFANNEWFEISNYLSEESAVCKYYNVIDKEGYSFNFKIKDCFGCSGFVFIQKSNSRIYTNIELTQKRKIEFLESKFQIQSSTDQSSPKRSFIDMLCVSDSIKNDLIEMLKNDFVPKKDKHNAIILAALNKIGILIIQDRTLIYRAIERDIFPIMESSSGINTYLKSYLDGAKTDITNRGKRPITMEDILPFVAKYQVFKE